MPPASKRKFDLSRKTRKEKDRARRIFALLHREYPDAACELHYTNERELLIATILSAQATDVSVNRVTPALFAAFPDADAFASAAPVKIEEYIRTIGLFRNKARSIHEAMHRVVTEYGGEIPYTMDALLTLRGVARKTANVVLGNAFGLNEGVVVDTHVMRLSQRFRLSSEQQPVRIERDLMALFPRDSWCLLSHLLIFHGRRACTARGHACTNNRICRTYCSEGRNA